MKPETTWHADQGATWRLWSGKRARSYWEHPDLQIIHVHNPAEGPAHWIIHHNGGNVTIYDGEEAGRQVLQILGPARHPGYSPSGHALRVFLGLRPQEKQPEPNDQTKTVI